MIEDAPVRRVEVTFVGLLPVRQLEKASGVSEVEVDGPVVRCTVTGSFQPFLEALLGHEVISLESTRRRS
jgi:ABC-2 type transport system ATP-binding protein